MNYEKEFSEMTRDEKFERYQYLCKVTASRYRLARGGDLEESDVVSVGMLGLMKAIDTYKPSLGVTFKHYALQKIHSYIKDMLRARDWVPRAVRVFKREHKEKVAELSAKLKRIPNRQEVADGMGMSVDQYLKNLALASRTDMYSLEEVYADQFISKTDCSDESIANVLKEALWKAVDALEERERAVLVYYYKKGKTFKEIGRLIGYSEPMAFKLHTRAIQNIRERSMEELQKWI